MVTHRILIVDDQQDVRHMLASGLRLLGPEFDVLEVPSAEEGFLLALRGEIDLLIVDVLLPGISGLELVEKVQRRNPQIKTILITGVEDSTIRQQVTQARVNAYFFKPIVLEEFIKTVLDCLGIVQGDQAHSLVPEEGIPNPGETVPILPDIPEGLLERLYTLRVELKAFAAIILDREGRVCAQSGEYPPLYEEPAAPSSLIEAWNAAERLSASLVMEQSDSLLCIAGRQYHLLLTGAGKLYMLLLVVSGPGFRSGWEQALKRAQKDLEHIIKTSRSESVQEIIDGRTALELVGQDVDQELADVDALLQKLKQVEIGDDVDTFWDRALEGDMFAGIDSADVLSYDQARKLGLAPQVGE